MTPAILGGFSREVVKIAEGMVVQNRPDRRPTENSAVGAVGAGAILGAGAGLGAHHGEAYLSGKRHLRALDRELMDRSTWQDGKLLYGSPEELHHLENFRAQHAPGVRVFHGDPEGFNKFVGGTGRPPASFDRAKKAIYTAAGDHPATLAHELGHASGTEFLRKLPLHKMYNISPFLSAGLGLVGAATALKKKTPEEQDKALRYSRNAALLGGLPAIPLIAEEARASIRAVNTARKVGKGMEYAKKLLPSFGQYVLSPQTGGVIGTALGIEALRRHLKRKSAMAPSSGAQPT